MLRKTGADVAAEGWLVWGPEAEVSELCCLWSVSDLCQNARGGYVFASPAMQGVPEC